MAYVDGFVLAVPEANIERYKALARAAGEVWMEYGALSYVECIGDDVPPGEATSFPLAVKAEPGEVVVFSWVTYADRAARDAIMQKVMEDPRMQDPECKSVFDVTRMLFGGFKPFMQLTR